MSLLGIMGKINTRCMINSARMNRIVVGVLLGIFFMLPIAHAQYFDDFGGFDGGFGGWDYGFDSFGGFDGGWSGGYGGAYDPCGSGGFSCYSQPFMPFYGGGFWQTPSQSSIDNHSVVTTNITTTASPAYTPAYTPVYQSSYPVYIPQPIYTAPPVYYPPPVYTPPPSYQQPIVCSAQFTNFSPPTTAVPWQLYSYRVTAISAVSGQMSYRLVTAPLGMGINSATGQITWTPGTNQVRSAAYQVTVAAYNGSCETAETFYVTVQPQPVVLYTPPPVAIGYVAPKLKPKPAPPESMVCPPTQTTPSTTVNESNFLANAASGFWGGITVLLASPFTLLLVIIILIILLVRANRRLGETPKVIPTPSSH